MDPYDSLVKAIYWTTVVVIAAWAVLLYISHKTRNKH